MRILTQTSKNHPSPKFLVPLWPLRGEVGVPPASLAATPQAPPKTSSTPVLLDRDEGSSKPAPDTHAGDSISKSPNQSDDTLRENALGLRTIKNIVHDQRQIWTSPAHVRLGHADWL